MWQVAAEARNRDWADLMTNILRKKEVDAISVQGLANVDAEAPAIYLLDGKAELPVKTENYCFHDLNLELGFMGKNYYLRILDSVYNRLDYEKFVSLAKQEGAELGGTTWLMLQLTFPLEFWSLSKRQGIKEKILRQQLQFGAQKILNLAAKRG